MAGIGIRLNKIFKRHTLIHTLYGSGYSMLATVTPMLVVIGAMLLMYVFLGFDSVRYYDRELFSCTILYVFIFSLLAASPFNSVLSKYVGDRIFEERYEDILPCIYVGMALNMGLAGLIGIPFHIWALVVGKIPLYWVFTAYCAYIGLGLCFYQMLYLSIVKAYKRISAFFFAGMLLCFVLSLIFRFLLGMSVLGWFGASGLVALFQREDQEVIAFGTRALRFQCISFPLLGWITMCNMMMQTIGKGVRASIMAMSRQGLFFIPLVIVLSSRIGFLGVQMSQPISDVLSFLVAIILQASVLREMNLQVKKEEAE